MLNINFDESTHSLLIKNIFHYGDIRLRRSIFGGLFGKKDVYEHLEIKMHSDAKAYNNLLVDMKWDIVYGDIILRRIYNRLSHIDHKNLLVTYHIDAYFENPMHINLEWHECENLNEIVKDWWSRGIKQRIDYPDYENHYKTLYPERFGDLY